MAMPTTEIDRRFGNPQAQPTPWADTESILRDAELYWLTTVRPDGRPHVTPLVGVWVDDAFAFTTGLGEQKTRNLEHHAPVAVTTGANTWARGLDVVVEGTAMRVTDHAALQRLAVMRTTGSTPGSGTGRSGTGSSWPATCRPRCSGWRLTRCSPSVKTRTAKPGTDSAESPSRPSRHASDGRRDGALIASDHAANRRVDRLHSSHRRAGDRTAGRPDLGPFTQASGSAPSAVGRASTGGSGGADGCSTTSSPRTSGRSSSGTSGMSRSASGGTYCRGAGGTSSSCSS